MPFPLPYGHVLCCSHVFEVQAAATAMDRSQVAVARVQAIHYCYQPGVRAVEVCKDPLPSRVAGMVSAVHDLEAAHSVSCRWLAGCVGRLGRQAARHSFNDARWSSRSWRRRHIDIIV